MSKTFARIEPTERHDVGNKYKIAVVVKHFMADDGVIHEFTTRGGEGERAGAVIALTPDNQVITSYQFRAGPEKWWNELPGGGFEENEDDETAVKRELLEETGYVPGEIEYLGESSRGGYFNIKWHYFFATNCTMNESGPQRDDSETAQGMETRLISISELIHYAKTNQMGDTHAVLMAYERLKKLEGES